MSVADNPWHTIEVGNESFTFLESTLKQAHVQDSLLGVVASGRWSHQPKFDIEPGLFRKYCVPFIRYGRLPTMLLENSEHVACAAEVLGLITLADRVRSDYADQPFLISLNFGRDLASLKVQVSRRTTLASIVEKLRGMPLFAYRDGSGLSFTKSHEQLQRVTDKDDLKEGRVLVLNDMILRPEKTIGFYPDIQPGTEILCLKASWLMLPASVT